MTEIKTIRRRKTYSDWVDRKNKLEGLGVQQKSLGKVLLFVHNVVNAMWGYRSTQNAQNSRQSLEQVIDDFSLRG